MTKLIAALVLVLLVAAASVAGAGPRSPAGERPHLFVVPTDGPAAGALSESDARLVARYGSFSLVEAAGQDAERLRQAGADQRDDMREVTVGDRTFDPARERRSLVGKGARPESTGLAVVQFVGPVKDSWLATLRATGVRVVTYMAQNGYLVHGSAKQLRRAGALLGVERSVRAVVPYTAADKLIGAIKRSGRQRLAVQTLTGAEGADARNEAAGLGRSLRAGSAVGPFRTRHVAADAGAARELAADPGVVAVLPSPEPELLDEAQDQIVAGNTTGTDPLLPSPPGYLAFVDGLVGTTTFPFAVDVTDEGIDAGVVGTTHPDLQVGGGGATRLSYVNDHGSDATANDCGGHGTINAGIVGGFNTGSGATVEDASGYNYGLGIAPRTLLGGSKIFTCAGAFSLTTPGGFSQLTEDAYAGGARISSNSWGCGGCADSYNADSQEYDQLTRDADDDLAGNQQMVEVFAAGNDGSGGGTIGTPGNGKNMITVGASENVRASGTDGCAVPNSGADDGHDIIDFSSRGPTPDGRIKPDVMGPGTHIVGTKPQHGSYNGNGVCNATFPAGSTLYSLSSGTSHSTPALAGVAALFRQWYTTGPGSGTPPSPALTKAALAQSSTDLVGGNDGAGGTNANVPNDIQGWGLTNIQRTLTSANRYFRDQQDVFGATGNTFSRVFPIQTPAQQVRVTLAYTDQPGPTGTNPVVNDLNLTVSTSAGTFKGNVFSGGVSVAGGSADPLNNLESVYLPPGTSGNIAVEVSAANIAGNGVPGNADPTDQDFALTVTNVGAETTAPVMSATSSSTAEVGGDGDGAIEPAEGFTSGTTLKNVGNAGATNVAGTLSSGGPVTFSDATTAWPDLAAGVSSAQSNGLAGTLDAGATCGAPVSMSLAVTTTEGANATFPISMPTGGVGAPVNRASTDVPEAIPDYPAAGATSVLNIPTAGTVKDVNVTIGSLSHTWVSDLKIDLVAPDATSVNLVNRPGGANNDDNNLLNVTFDDEAATAIGPPNPGANATPAYTGTFRPQADQLSRFDDKSQQGTWTLKMSDHVGQDAGTLNSWSTDIGPAECDAAPPVPPGAITGLAATGQVEAVSLDWDDTPAATSYKVFRRNPDTSYPLTPTATPSTSDYTDTGRTPGQHECYKVQATGAGGDGPMSGETCATPTAPPTPGAIAGLTATAEVQAVALQWDDASFATGYKVYRKQGGIYPGTPMATPAVSELTDTGRTAGVQDCYVIQATGAGGDGAMSGEVCATPLAPGSAPGQAIDLTAAGAVEQVALDWTDTPTATSYFVWRLNPDGSTPALPLTTVEASQHSDTGLFAGTQQCYKVSARNAFGDGPESAAACATPTASGGGGTGGGGGGVVELPILPKLDLSGQPGTVKVNRRGRFSLTFDTNQAGSLTLTSLKAFATAKKKKLTLAKGTFTAPATGKVTLKFKLSRKHLKALRKAKRMRASLKVKAGELQSSKTLKLKAPKPRRKK